MQIFQVAALTLSTRQFDRGAAFDRLSGADADTGPHESCNPSLQKTAAIFTIDSPNLVMCGNFFRRIFNSPIVPLETGAVC